MQTDASPKANPASSPATSPPTSAAGSPSAEPLTKPLDSALYQAQALDPALVQGQALYSAYNIWRNTKQSWGYPAIIFHWLSALAILVLFPLGLWMTGLTYYDPWYKLAPDLHKSIGITLFSVFVARLAWRFWDPAPGPVPGHKRWEHKTAHATHLVLYIFVFAVMLSGYLISTADGRAISVFGLFDVPATITSIPKQEDVAGALHFWLAVTLIGIVGVHGGAALKHHSLDKDSTLLRMLPIHMLGKRIMNRR